MTELLRRQKKSSSYDLDWESWKNTEATLTWKLLNSAAITAAHSFVREIPYVNMEVRDWNADER